jgi:hypothetical protein
MYGPVDGVAYSSGQIGFEPVSPVDVIRGYRITAQGELVDEPPLFEVSELR